MTKFFIAQSNFKKEEVEGEIRTFNECPNEQFGYRKIGDSNWNVTHIRSGLEVIHCKSKSACTKELKRLLSHPEIVKQIQATLDIDTVLEKRKKEAENQILENKTFKELYDEFKKITGISCPLDIIFGGIDIVKLDKLIETPDGTSMTDYIKTKYGNRANEVIDAMTEYSRL